MFLLGHCLGGWDVGDVDILYGNHCLHHTLEVWVGGGGERTKTPLSYSSIPCPRQFSLTQSPIPWTQLRD